MTDTIQLRELMAAGCGACHSVESLMRSGVPLSQIEVWLDFNDNRLPAVAARKPTRVLGTACKRLSVRPMG